MPRNLALKRGLRLLPAGIIGCLLGNWHASALRLPEATPAEIVARRFPDLAPSQIVAQRFPDLAPSQIVALRFPDLAPPQTVAPRFADLSLMMAAARPFSDDSSAGAPFVAKPTAHSVTAAPVAPVRLIDFEVTAALPPIGHSRFCLRYPSDCQVHAIDFRRRNIKLTPQRWNELNMVNRAVNRRIFAEVTPGDGASDNWVIAPPAGDCTDYAVTKRHELLAQGWPSRALLLSEVVLPSGEHHLLLVVRAKNADLVLDNLNDDIRLVAMTYNRYDWVRIESPKNPKFWMSVHGRDAAVRTAVLSD